MIVLAGNETKFLILDDIRRTILGRAIANLCHIVNAAITFRPARCVGAKNAKIGALGIQASACNLWVTAAF